MSRIWSMFRFRSFQIFCEKIAIFRTFDHWSEILSMSAGRPLGQGVCPPLCVSSHLSMVKIYAVLFSVFASGLSHLYVLFFLHSLYWVRIHCIPFICLCIWFFLALRLVPVSTRSFLSCFFLQVCPCQHLIRISAFLFLSLHSVHPSSAFSSNI